MTEVHIFSFIMKAKAWTGRPGFPLLTAPLLLAERQLKCSACGRAAARPYLGRPGDCTLPCRSGATSLNFHRVSEQT